MNNLSWMEQLTEFVSKSFSAERLAMIPPPVVMTSASSTITPSHLLASGPASGHSSALSFAGLPFFRSHPNPFDPRLNLPPHLMTGLSFFNPNLFGTSSSSLLNQVQSSSPSPSSRSSLPVIDLSLIKSSRNEDKSPSLSPGRGELCLSQASVTDIDSRQSLDENSGEEDAGKTFTGKKSFNDYISVLALFF